MIALDNLGKESSPRNDRNCAARVEVSVVADPMILLVITLTTSRSFIADMMIPVDAKGLTEVLMQYFVGPTCAPEMANGRVMVPPRTISQRMKNHRTVRGLRSNIARIRRKNRKEDEDTARQKHHPITHSRA